MFRYHPAVQKANIKPIWRGFELAVLCMRAAVALHLQLLIQRFKFPVHNVKKNTLRNKRNNFLQW